MFYNSFFLIAQTVPRGFAGKLHKGTCRMHACADSLMQIEVGEKLSTYPLFGAPSNRQNACSTSRLVSIVIPGPKGCAVRPRVLITDGAVFDSASVPVKKGDVHVL